MTGSSVKEVLYTIKAFENKVSDLNIPSNRLIKEFMNCLGSKARDRWAKLSKQRDREGLGPFPQTQEGWEQAKSNWIIEYAKDSKAKDAIISAWTSTSNYMKPKETEVEDHADRIDTICTYIDLLPGNHNILTDMEKKSLLFNSFPKTWRLEFTLNRNDPEQASEKEIKDFMEKKKEMADREDNHKERTKAKVKRMEDSKKKRLDKKGNQPCRTHNGEHLWKDCPANPKNRGCGGMGRNTGRGFGNFNLNRNFNRGRGFQGRSFQGRGFQGRSFPGRNPQARGFGRGMSNPQEQYYSNIQKEYSDASTIATTPSHDWDSHISENYHLDNHYPRGYHHHSY